MGNNKDKPNIEDEINELLGKLNNFPKYSLVCRLVFINLFTKFRLKIPKFFDFFLISLFLIIIILEYKIDNIFFVSLFTLLLSPNFFR